jgi:5,10-methylenetetrahydromethanopterin reductase
MEIGFCLPTKANSWEVVKRAEELGFSHAWFYDTHLLNAEVIVAMGAAAVKTS